MGRVLSKSKLKHPLHKGQLSSFSHAGTHSFVLLLPKITELEKKLKQVSQELECQRHNADAARQTQEQRFKEKEKEHNMEISQQMQAYKSLDQQLQVSWCNLVQYRVYM